MEWEKRAYLGKGQVGLPLGDICYTELTDQRWFCVIYP